MNSIGCSDCCVSNSMITRLHSVTIRSMIHLSKRRFFSLSVNEANVSSQFECYFGVQEAFRFNLESHQGVRKKNKIVIECQTFTFRSLCLAISIKCSYMIYYSCRIEPIYGAVKIIKSLLRCTVKIVISFQQFYFKARFSNVVLWLTLTIHGRMRDLWIWAVFFRYSIKVWWNKKVSLCLAAIWILHRKYRENTYSVFFGL